MTVKKRLSIFIKYGQVTIGISVFMDDIMSTGGHTDVTKTIKNCREMEETKKFTYG